MKENSCNADEIIFIGNGHNDRHVASTMLSILNGNNALFKQAILMTG